MNHRNLTSIYIGVALLSVASLALEISYTRFFSITRWHHFAFMVVSMALLGYSAAGSLLALRPDILSRHTSKLLWMGSMGFSAASLVGYIGANILPMDPARAAWDTGQFVLIFPLYLLVSAPFFFTGLNFAAALAIYRGKTHGIYASDLLGAGIGCGITLFIFNYNGSAGAIPTCSALGALSAACFALGWNRKALGSALGIMMMIIMLIFLHPGPLRPRISPFKDLMVALQYPGARHINTQWNAYSRIDLVESPAARFAPGISLGFDGSIPSQTGITSDGDNLNAIMVLTGKPGERDFIHWLPASLPYILNPSGHVFIIEPGGNLDFFIAETFKAASITAAIQNNLVIRELEKGLSDFSESNGSVLQMVQENGRSFLRRSLTARFDVIRLPITGALAAASSGLYGLQEQYEYTMEAFRLYFSRLSHNGIISVSRYLIPPPREEIRIWAVAIAALENLGIADPGRHMAAFRSLTTLEILISRKEWGEKELNKIRDFCALRWFDVVYLPDMRAGEANQFNQFPGPIYAEPFRQIMSPEGRSELYNTYLFDINPTTDDRPFLSHVLKWSTLRQVIQAVGGKWQILLEGGYLVPVVAIQALVMALILILVPLTGKHIDYSDVRRYIPFVVFIGLGFIFLEIGMIHRMTLYLGHPYHAIALTLSVILVSSGIGSRLCGHRIRKEKSLGILVIVISFIVLADELFMRYFLFEISSWKPFWRTLFAGIFLSSTGFVMGIPFPSVLRFIHESSKGMGNVPWAWSINGGATVVGSTMAAITALELGIRAIFLLSAACYFLAGICTMIKFYSVNRK